MEQYATRIQMATTAAQLIEVLDDYEQDLAISEYPLEIAQIHLMAYLADWDVVNARFLYKRHEIVFNLDVLSLTIVDFVRELYANNYDNWPKQRTALKSAIAKTNNGILFSLMSQLEKRMQKELDKLIQKNFVNISKTTAASFNREQVEDFANIIQATDESTLDISQIKRLSELLKK